MRYPKIFLILLNYNKKKETLESLTSLMKIQSPKFQLLMVDHFSQEDELLSFRKSYPHIPILENRENFSFVEGTNQGIQWALSKGAQWIFLLKNEAIVDPFVIEGFLQAIENQPNGKIFGAKIYRHDQPDEIDHLGGYFDAEKANCFSFAQGEKEDHLSFETMHQVDYVSLAAMLIHHSVFETIGFFEPDFFFFWEEIDFCFRAKRAGIEIWTAPLAKVWHKVVPSSEQEKNHSHYFWWRSRLLWLFRNISFEQRKKIYQKVIFKELLQALGLYFLQSSQAFFTKKETPRQKAKEAKAALLGAFYYSIKRFGRPLRQKKDAINL